MNKVQTEMPKKRKVPWDKVESIKAVWKKGMTVKEICAAIKNKKPWGDKRPNSEQIIGVFHRYPEEMRPCHLNRRGFAQGTTRKKRATVAPTPSIEPLEDINLPALMDRSPTGSERRYELDKQMLKREKTFETKGSMTSNLEPSRSVTEKTISIPKVYGTGTRKFEMAMCEPYKPRNGVK